MQINTDFFLSANSKRDDEGNLVYYPIGIFWRGYKVPSHNDEVRLRKSAALFNLVGIPVFIIVAAYVSIAAAICGLVLTIMLSHILFWRKYRTWVIFNERLKYKEILARKRMRLKGTVFYLLWCISCFMFIFSVEFLWLKLDEGYIPFVLLLVSSIGAIFSWKALMPRS